MTEPEPGADDGGRPPLAPAEKRARVGATAAAIAIAAVVTSIVLGIGVAALLATVGSGSDGDDSTRQLAVPTSAATTAPDAPAVPVLPSESAPSEPVPPEPVPPEPAPLEPAPPESAPPESAPAESAPSESAQASATPATPPPPTPGTAGEANKEAQQAPPEVDVAAGECVSAFDAEEVTEAACGSAGSRYKVVSAGPAGTVCPSDADSSHTIADTTMCLDIDWAVGNCMAVSGDTPEPTDCGPGAVEVVSILPDTDSVNACPSADSGFVYDERRFVVCFAEL